MDKLLQLIPGYSGYKNKEKIRENDRLVREGIYRSLKDSVIVKLNEINRLVVTYLPNERELLEIIRRKMDTLAEKIVHAKYGYAPLNSNVKVREKELKRLVEFDQSLANYVISLIQHVDYLLYILKSGAYTDPSRHLEIHNALLKIDWIVDQLETTLNARENLFLQVK